MTIRTRYRNRPGWVWVACENCAREFPDKPAGYEERSGPRTYQPDKVYNRDCPHCGFQSPTIKPLPRPTREGDPRSWPWEKRWGRAFHVPQDNMAPFRHKEYTDELSAMDFIQGPLVDREGKPPFVPGWRKAEKANHEKRLEQHRIRIEEEMGALGTNEVDRRDYWRSQEASSRTAALAADIQPEDPIDLTPIRKQPYNTPTLRRGITFATRLRFWRNRKKRGRTA